MKIPLLIVMIAVMAGCAGKKQPVSREGEDLPQYQCSPLAALTTDAEWYRSDSKAPIFEGLDILEFPVTTSSEAAQRYFNQGLILAYGFNHAEAARSFHYATRLDPECAMCHWGFAYVLGPNYNAGMEPDNYQRAYASVQKALELSAKAEPHEQALISALAERYVAEPVEDRSALDQAYSDAMKEVAASFPDNADISALYAESLMDLHPWDLYDKQGAPLEWTPGILAALENVFTIDPEHPGAHHFYIHAVEASAEPERGLPSAELLDRGLVPGAGHLVHMPSHIYIRTGYYHKGTAANIRAVEVDSLYTTMCHAQGAYPLAYYPHNWHFLTATASLEGNSKWAVLAADKLAEHTNTDVMKAEGWGTLQHYYTIPYNVRVKFGRWDEILEMENSEPELKYPAAVRHYARGMAFLAHDDLDQARSELEILDVLAEDEVMHELTVWDINSVYSLVQIARRVLRAEIMAAEGMYAESIRLLKEARDLEDALNYDEPPDWFFSVRHRLGAVQVEAGEYRDALKTYEQDLDRLPRNGWALHGMKAAYQGLGDSKKAADVDAALADIWSTADIRLTGSRLK